MAKYRFEEIAYNSTEKKKPVEEDRFTYIGLEHLDPGTLKVTRFGSDVAPIGEKLVMKEGDVLFGKRRAYQKKVAVAPFDGIFSAHGMVLRPKEDVIDKSFFPLFISSDYFLDAAIKISVGSLSPTINWRDLKILEFELPPLAEQRKLAKVLWAVNATMESYKRLITATEQFVKTQFIEMFGLPDSNVYGWESATIRDVVTDVRYGTSKPASDEGKYTYLRMNNITYDGQLDLSETKAIDIPDEEVDKCLVRRGDLLFNRTNSRVLVGKTCVFNEDKPMVIAGYIIRVRFGERILPEYISTMLNIDYGKKLLLNMCKGAIGQANINAQEFQNISILVPPMELQLQFKDLLRQADKSKFELEQALKELDSIYKRIISENLG
ncbi:restriction endonuclease subunit S [Paenibacillus lautus]|uniref:restriction endonuclease subunit S n=1 Tax=Paenibacillus lautus TaxID=1401 RepID=UPI002DBF9E49|nr:restriction endonuclease subunit S [Paenibacillus lautus]MEC0305736.1 restriction endonuclease subunit S [Paenibacillus lautus]